MNKRRITSLAAAGVLLCSMVSAQAAPVPRHTASQAAQPSDTASQLESEAYGLINRQRAAHGLTPLRADPSLGRLARIKSRDMASGGYFDHSSPTYGSPFSMMKALGVSYSSAGENIAKGYHTAAQVAAAWMSSDSHRANLLSERYTTMGIGHFNGYWTLWLIS